jgi:hypothetical protein
MRLFEQDAKQKSNKTMEKLNNANWKAAKEEAAYQAEMDKLRRKGSQDKRTSESEKRVRGEDVHMLV